MNLANRKLGSYVYVLLIALSFLFSYLLVVMRDFPYLGLGIVFASISTLVFAFRRVKLWEDNLLYILLMALSVFFVWRSEGFITFLNLISVVYFGSYFSFDHEERVQMSLATLLFLPLVLLFRLVIAKNSVFFDLHTFTGKDKSHAKQKSLEIGFSLIITLILLIVILPLLSSANPIFGKLINNVISFLNIQKFLDSFFNEFFTIHLVRFIFFGVFAFFLPRLLSFAKTQPAEARTKNAFSITFPLLIPKAALAAVLIVFFITQAQLYFSTETTLKAMGYSNSQYAREVFAQLSIVAFIIFMLVYNDKATDKWSRFLTHFLLIEALFLNAIGFKSDYDYSSRFGFTMKRLYGFSIVAWLTGVVSLFLYALGTIQKRPVFLRNAIVFTGILIAAINLLNFDYLIYHYSKSRTGEGADYAYLSRLSADSYSYHEQLKVLEKDLEKHSETTSLQRAMSWSLMMRIDVLRFKYKDVDWRTFNISEYMQYKKLESMNIDGIREQLVKKQLIYPLVFPAK